MLYAFLRLVAILICKILFRIKVFGRKNMPERGAFILASNHLSYLDPVVLGIVCSRRLNFMAKKDLFASRVSSWFFYKLGAFPVERNSADISAIKEAIRRIKNNGILVIFPEGTRKLEDNLAAPHSGIGFLSAKLGVPVIPAFIKGTDVALPRHAKLIRPAQISVCFGKQISIERGLPYQEIADEIMRNIRHLSCKVAN